MEHAWVKTHLGEEDNVHMLNLQDSLPHRYAQVESNANLKRIQKINQTLLHSNMQLKQTLDEVGEGNKSKKKNLQKSSVPTGRSVLRIFRHCWRDTPFKIH